MDTRDLIAALVFDGTVVPEEAIEAAAARRAEMIPAFTAEIEAFCAIPRPTTAEILASPVFVIALLLGEWRATAAYRAFCRLVRRNERVVDMLFGDAIQHVASIAVRLFDGDPQPLIEAALDPGADSLARSAMFEALAELAVTGAADRGTVEDFVRRAQGELQPRRDDLVWFGWTQAVAVLALADMAPLAREAIQAGRVPVEITSVKHFNADLAHAEAHPDAPWPQGLGVEDLEPASVILRGYTEEGGYDGADAQEPGLTVVNPLRDVGRNDPCPCGSGKKFKKCCLGKDAA